MGQDDIFLNSEGDSWFLRNKKHLLDPEKLRSDVPLRILSLYPDFHPKKILEVGCSVGTRLNYLQNKFAATAVGVDPSEAAIDEGRKHYPKIQFQRGLASDMNAFGLGTFDLVVVNFVFHWIGRERLKDACSAIDASIASNGVLIIGDFFPAAPEVRPYHHLPKGTAFTYKQFYPDLFTGTSRYLELARLSFNHDTGEYSIEATDKERAHCSLLVKLGSQAE